MSSNSVKSERLGMPVGTASNRLRKMILFSLVQKCGLDTCFKCGSKIETVDELSIEHKKPWEGVDVALFWDLDNIAFSHLRCNTPHFETIRERFAVKDGKSWCSACKGWHNVEEFAKDVSRHTGLAKHCKKVDHQRRVERRRVLGK